MPALLFVPVSTSFPNTFTSYHTSGFILHGDSCSECSSLIFRGSANCKAMSLYTSNYTSLLSKLRVSPHRSPNISILAILYINVSSCLKTCQDS
jgi:hypothetical protein